MKIRGIYHKGDILLNCKGSIGILSRTGRNIYAVWEMDTGEGTHLASVSRNYFVDKEEVTNSDVVPLILMNIQNYKVARKKVFSEIEIVFE